MDMATVMKKRRRKRVTLIILTGILTSIKIITITTIRSRSNARKKDARIKHISTKTLSTITISTITETPARNKLKMKWTPPIIKISKQQGTTLIAELMSLTRLKS